jgi:hypothetical protein
MLDTTIRLVSPGGTPIGTMDAKIWQSMHDTLLEYGVIATPLDVNGLYTDRFLKETQ